MRLLKSFAVAFAMYSKIPMPRVDWSKESMRYAMCFFPLIGAVCGALLYLWALLCATLGFGAVLYAGVAVLLPLLVTGGIHLDGFCDTIDALSSHQSTERKLEILKDPHIGAFGVMGCVAYLLLGFALWAELVATPQNLLILGFGYVLSRTLSGLSVVSFRCARGNGSLAAFSDGAQKKVVTAVLLLAMCLCFFLMIDLSLLVGGAAIAAALVVFLCYRVMCYRAFGGTTGDLAGWFLSVCELAMLGAVVLAGRVLV